MTVVYLQLRSGVTVFRAAHERSISFSSLFRLLETKTSRKRPVTCSPAQLHREESHRQSPGSCQRRRCVSLMVLLRQISVALTAAVAALGSALFIALNYFYRRRIWSPQTEYCTIKEVGFTAELSKLHLAVNDTWQAGWRKETLQKDDDVWFYWLRFAWRRKKKLWSERAMMKMSFM